MGLITFKSPISSCIGQWPTFLLRPADICDPGERAQQQEWGRWQARQNQGHSQQEPFQRQLVQVDQGQLLKLVLVGLSCSVQHQISSPAVLTLIVGINARNLLVLEGQHMKLLHVAQRRHKEAAHLLILESVE